MVQNPTATKPRYNPVFYVIAAWRRCMVSAWGVPASFFLSMEHVPFFVVGAPVCIMIDIANHFYAPDLRLSSADIRSLASKERVCCMTWNGLFLRLAIVGGALALIFYTTYLRHTGQIGTSLARIYVTSYIAAAIALISRLGITVQGADTLAPKAQALTAEFYDAETKNYMLLRAKHGWNLLVFPTVCYWIGSFLLLATLMSLSDWSGSLRLQLTVMLLSFGMYFYAICLTPLAYTYAKFKPYGMLRLFLRRKAGNESP